MLAVTLVSLVAALADLVGGWFTIHFTLLRGEMERLMALGAGFLLGSALLTMLPAALHHPGGAVSVTAGFAAFLLLRMLIVGLSPREGGAVGVESAWAIFSGMLMHSLVEGVALGMAVQAGGAISWVALAATLLHKLPEGFSMAMVVLAAAGSARTAMAAVTAVGLATVLGAWGAVLWSKVALLSHGAIVGIAAGSFLYVGATEMLPHVLRKGGSTWLVLAGMLLVYLLTASALSTHTH